VSKATFVLNRIGYELRKSAHYPFMIHFSNADSKVSFKRHTALKTTLREMFRQEGAPLQSLSYVFCSDDYLLQINKDFLQHDYYTDIITFEMADNPDLGVEGEIYISVDRVKENAIALGQTFYNELARVIFHGALHLCGYKDKTGRDKKAMRAMEDKYLQFFDQCSTENSFTMKRKRNG
jgi:probable rRNA maturation factor